MMWVPIPRNYFSSRSSDGRYAVNGGALMVRPL
jgi:hypothetical protein